jgi:hypothetical protein
MPDTAPLPPTFIAWRSILPLPLLQVWGPWPSASLPLRRSISVGKSLSRWPSPSFALGLAVLLLRRWHINRVLAVISVVILGVGAVIGTQLAHLAENVPGYHSNITEKIHSLRNTTTSNGVVGRTATMLSDLGNEITKPRDNPRNMSFGVEAIQFRRNAQCRDQSGCGVADRRRSVGPAAAADIGPIVRPACRLRNSVVAGGRLRSHPAPQP